MSHDNDANRPKPGDTNIQAMIDKVLKQQRQMVDESMAVLREEIGNQIAEGFQAVLAKIDESKCPHAGHPDQHKLDGLKAYLIEKLSAQENDIDSIRDILHTALRGGGASRGGRPDPVYDNVRLATYAELSSLVQAAWDDLINQRIRWHRWLQHFLSHANIFGETTEDAAKARLGRLTTALVAINISRQGPDAHQLA
ncbi:hypothetical protein PG987_006034 [Apiospora arundinis]